MDIRRPKAKVETDYSYTNKFIGRRIRFTPKPDEIVATFQPQPDAKATIRIMKAVPLARSKPMIVERGVAVFRVLPTQNLPAARRILEAADHVASIMPVLIDDEGATRYFVPGELTVQFHEGVTTAQAERIIHQSGCQIVFRHRTPGYYTLSVPAGRGVFEMIRAFSDMEEVEFAEPSEIVYDAFTYVPDDPRATEQYAWGIIQAGLAWDVSRGASNVIIAVIDTGADLDHPDLEANIFPRGGEDWDFTSSGEVPEDFNSHGTHVAGIAAAVDNTVGIIGLAHLCRIMPLKIGPGPFLETQASVDAINYVASEAQAHLDLRYVMNLSWGKYGYIAGLQRAIRRAVDNNALVIAAAGNDGLNIDERPHYPAAFPEVIAVAATDMFDQRGVFGLSSSNFGTKVDVSAPGVGILSTALGGEHKLNSGTSMAAPHVAGLAALIWSLDPTLSSDQVRQVIERTCDNIDAFNPGFENLLGKGRINAFKALSAIAYSLILPSRLEVPPGGSGKVGVIIKRAAAFAANVDLAAGAALPAGVTVSFDPSTTSGTNSTMTVSVATNVSQGPYTLVVQGTSGNITKTAALQLTVKTFTLSLSEPDVILKGDDEELKSADVTVTINRMAGFNDSVQLSIEGLPVGAPPGAGITATFNPSSTTGSTSILHLSAG
ncbi:MAG TPA: S8 family peptidase, partial [Caldilineaceae bacterium]|nr:S8 family peptidase [Caldilineaceae bacterium]